MPFQKGHVPANKGQKNAGAPAVIVERSGHRVRLRNLDYAIEGCLSTEKEEIRYRLEPNKWCDVPDNVYQELKHKFSRPQVTESTDWEPGGEGARAERVQRRDEHQEYILEFSDER